ncbi:C2 domain and Copine domain-containing protein [Strongyloides ratti]|uniref:C2 domain and Copine domain-containing protein n=1 Tax=Strongyloides ratti TaxID=34506 RepID=A0A090N109_STRRB|nr:C2 domain and Copine domain-containing protein [Strongyloides ratti]CEF71618.1 C2 domain and Copine domain-containing protein [Strongyloides ratti]
MEENYLNTSEMLDIQISCINLPMESYSGCKIVGFIGTSNDFRKFYDTDVFFNNINPVFNHKSSIIYHFEGRQKLQFFIYSANPVTKEENFLIGKAIFNLHDLLLLGGVGTAKIDRDPTKIDQKQATSQICVRIHKSKKELATLIKFKASGLSSQNSYPLNPYFTVQIFDKEEPTNIILLHKSEIIRGSQSPNWKSFITLTKYLNLYKESMIKINVFNYNPNTMDSLIGSFNTTFFQLVQGQALKFSLNSITGAKLNDMTIDVIEFKPYEMTSFSDLILKDKLRIHCTIGIDFTAFNGPIEDPYSCHHFQDGERNDYQKILQNIFEDLSNCDLSRKVCVFGFGGRNKKSQLTSHLMPLECEKNKKPYFVTIDSLLNTYEKFLNENVLSTPCDFSDIIHQVKGMAKASKKNCKNENIYFLLIILTRGCVKNNKKIIDAIVGCSILPLSIVVIPVGNIKYSLSNIYEAEFNNIFLPQIKDSDNNPLLREVITIVNSSIINNCQLSQYILQHIPRHVESWSNNFSSNQ